MLLLLVCLLVPACLVCAPDPPPQKDLRDKLTEILPNTGGGGKIKVVCEDSKFNVIQLTIRTDRQSLRLTKIVDTLCGKKPGLRASSEEKDNYKCCKAIVEKQLWWAACAGGLKQSGEYYYEQPSKCANAIFPETRTLPDECTQTQ